MLVEELNLEELQALIIEHNPTGVWANMVHFGLVQDAETMPEIDVMMDILYEKTRHDAAEGAVMLSHILDVESDGNNMDADSDLETVKASVTAGDLVALNVFRNNEDAFRLKSKTEENITSFFALLGFGCSIYLLFQGVKKLLK